MPVAPTWTILTLSYENCGMQIVGGPTYVDGVLGELKQKVPVVPGGRRW